ncbi:hypothetical protein SNEBB_003717 [Seison nebaliae]|nr:hypothetical protein SNEBB_003717 [Seison nebaliae]
MRDECDMKTKCNVPYEQLFQQSQLCGRELQIIMACVAKLPNASGLANLLEQIFAKFSDAKHAVVCPKQKAKLSCNRGRILQVHYGIIGYPPSQHAMTKCNDQEGLRELAQTSFESGYKYKGKEHCYITISPQLLGGQCNGKRTCLINAKELVGDLAKKCTTKKLYVELVYSCLDKEKEKGRERIIPAVACDGIPAILTCPRTTVINVIHRAIYGITMPPAVVCPAQMFLPRTRLANPPMSPYINHMYQPAPPPPPPSAPRSAYPVYGKRARAPTYGGQAQAPRYIRQQQPQQSQPSYGQQQRSPSSTYQRKSNSPTYQQQQQRSPSQYGQRSQSQYGQQRQRSQSQYSQQRQRPQYGQRSPSQYGQQRQRAQYGQQSDNMIPSKYQSVNVINQSPRQTYSSVMQSSLSSNGRYRKKRQVERLLSLVSGTISRSEDYPISKIPPGAGFLHYYDGTNHTGEHRHPLRRLRVICGSKLVYNYVMHQCLGKNTCMMFPHPGLLGSPCKGAFAGNQFYVEYSCTKRDHKDGRSHQHYFDHYSFGRKRENFDDFDDEDDHYHHDDNDDNDDDDDKDDDDYIVYGEDGEETPKRYGRRFPGRFPGMFPGASAFPGAMGGLPGMMGGHPGMMGGMMGGMMAGPPAGYGAWGYSGYPAPLSGRQAKQMDNKPYIPAHSYEKY